MLLKSTITWLISDNDLSKCLKNTSTSSLITPNQQEQQEQKEEESNNDVAVEEGHDIDIYDEACILSEFNLNDKIVLDLGCGTGYLILWTFFLLLIYC